MQEKKSHILLCLKSNYHELLISRELQSAFPDIHITPVLTKLEAFRVIAKEDVVAYILEIYSHNFLDFKNIHQTKLLNPELPILAITDDNSDEFLLKLQEIGINEILYKNEAFYQGIPKIIDSMLQPTKVSSLPVVIGRKKKESEVIKLATRTLSHEINNPLMAILGLTELILDSKELYDDNLIEKIKKIDESAKRIQTSVHRLSNVSSPAIQKTASGMMINPEKSRISVNSLLKLTETE